MAARTLIAETGADMNRFPSAQHQASWAGVRPDNHESASKKRSDKSHRKKFVCACDNGIVAIRETRKPGQCSFELERLSVRNTALGSWRMRRRLTAKSPEAGRSFARRP
ncbi:MAG: transposase [Bryobacterales bacterium]|nr:transposase [Bryobacterales bacterium]